MSESNQNKCTALPPYSAAEAFQIACKTAMALEDQCRYMRSINEEPSELAEDALVKCVRARYLPNSEFM